MPGETEREVIIPREIISAVTDAEAYALAALARGKSVLELGAHYGFSTVVLASVAERVLSVDWHQGDPHAGSGYTLEIFRGNVERYGLEGRVCEFIGLFEDELPRLAQQGVQVDGAFLDGHHSAESVARDLELTLPLVRPGGFVAFHDYGRGPHNGFEGFGVTEVADRFGIAGSVGHLGWGFTPRRTDAHL